MLPLRTITTSLTRATSNRTLAFTALAASSVSLLAVLASRPHLPGLATFATSTQVNLAPSRLKLFPATFEMGLQSSTSAKDPSSFPKGKTDSEWRTVLTPEQFRILREKGTERAGTGEYDSHYKEGVYNCAGCGTALYKSATKFKSGCGWPAFFDAIPGAVERHVDSSWGMQRIEITCKACGGHLGHVFKGEGFPTPTDERHCVNSISLRFDDSADGKL